MAKLNRQDTDTADSILHGYRQRTEVNGQSKVVIFQLKGGG